MLWGEEQIANTANALQAQIGQLRRTLGATAIVTSEAGYALDIGPDDLDAARFEQLVAKGRRLLEEGEAALASSTLSEALQLRRGEPLNEFAYAGFADAERAHLDDLTLVAIEARVEADLVLGHHGELPAVKRAPARSAGQGRGRPSSSPSHDAGLSGRRRPSGERPRAPGADAAGSGRGSVGSSGLAVLVTQCPSKAGPACVGKRVRGRECTTAPVQRG